MTNSTLVRFTACLSSILSLASCSDQKASPGPCNAGDPGCLAVGGSNGTGGSSNGSGGASVKPTGGTTASSATGGVPSSGGATANTSAGTGGSSSTRATGGTSATGGSSSTKVTGGASGTGGSSSTKATGGTSATGGSSSTKATGGTSATGGSSSTRTTGGTSATGGTNATGGTSATGGSVAATGGSVTVDPGGKSLAKRGDSTNKTNDYLYLGNMRLLNNNWGSVELNNSGKSCNAPMSVQVGSDGSLGWNFNRGNCGDDGGHPDYPELEFGVGPFGSASSLLTSPAYSSTTLLPIQVKDIQTAIVTIDNFAINLQGGTNWNLNIEFWLSRNNPLTNTDGGVYAEFMGVWGWNPAATWWNCTPALNQSVTSGGKTYNLCHQDDNWGSTWRFFQFEATGGSQRSFNGTVDIKSFLDWFYNSSYASGASKDLWLTRIELGTEIGDSTSGTCSIKNISFNINGTTQGPLFAP